jgi:UDP-3-O-[3-hydroxymyristoyl] glucosamine N-acyltransferase
MREYPREVESQNIYRGLSADILYGNVLDTASPQELRKLSRSEISPDAKALVKLKLSNAPLRAEIDPQSIPKQLLKALHPSKATSHLTPDQVAKAFEVSPKQAKEALGIVQEALGKSSDRSHASAKKQRKQETSFKRWLDGRYEGIGIQNPNPGLKDPIDPDTLLTYAGNSDYEFQRNALSTKKQLWDQWWKESEEKRKAEASQLRDQLRAYKPRIIHPDAKVENPENIGPDALVNKDAVISGNAKVLGNAFVGGDAKISGGDVGDDAVVNGGEISGGRVRGKAQVSGGEISGKAWVDGNAEVSGGVISGDAKVKGNAKVSGNAQISGGLVWSKAQVSGGTISSGRFAGNCKIRGGNWDEYTLSVMERIPEYKKHFEDGELVRGEWDDLPEDVKKKLEELGPTGKHPDAKVENPKSIGSNVLIGKNAVISGDAKVKDKALVTGGEISGGTVYGNAVVTGGKISGDARVFGGKVSGGEVSGGKMYGGIVSGDAKISGGSVRDNAKVSGGTISGGAFGGNCKIHGGNWDEKTLKVMRSMPEYGEHFRYGELVSGEWNDVPEDVKKKLEPFGPTGQHPDAKIENPDNIGPGVLVGKDAVISGDAKVLGNAVVSGDAKISGGSVGGDAVVSGDAKISGKALVGDNAVVSGDAKVSGGEMMGKAQVSGGAISGGYFSGKCKIHGGKWDENTLSVMERIPEYKKHFEYGGLISGEWDDVPDDVKKKLEPPKEHRA